jgi:uncharacterized SAM-binding protein YcdF (DUF218 family)
MSRRRWILLAVASTLTVLVTILSVTLFILPSTNTPQDVSAIAVLGGSGSRLSRGEALIKAGFSHVLVVSTSATGWICPSNLTSVRVVCFTAHPLSTRGEAEFLGKIQRREHLTSILVVTAVPQTTRARIRIERCFSGEVLFDPVVPGGLWSWVYNTVYEWGALFKALVLQRSC